jgi:glycosyltransferase involved in cell wall biosynthesis
LHVLHADGGGTERHVRELIEASDENWRHYLAIVIADRWIVEEHRGADGAARFGFERRADEAWPAFVEGLCATFGISLIHLHNVSGCREGFQEALAALSIPFGYTIHDLSWACPRITFLDASGHYCGGVTEATACNGCLRDSEPLAAVDIVKWRARHRSIVDAAAFLIAPSRWAADMFERYFPNAAVNVIAHGTRGHPHARSVGTRLAVLMPDDRIPVVAVIGAIGPDKGARRIERLLALARKRDIALRIVVIGYTDVHHVAWQSDDLRITIHGRYHPDDLPDLLAHYRVSLVLFPSEGPETFSYTLSEIWRAGMPVLVPPIGALAERVAGARAGFVLTQEQWTDDAAMLQRIVDLTSVEANIERDAAAVAARNVEHATLADMGRATFALYDTALATAPARRAYERFSQQRVRDAQSYAPWSPPRSEVDASDAPRASGTDPGTVAWWRRLARVARSLRRTGVGRVLYSLIPSPWIASLKARLDT